MKFIGTVSNTCSVPTISLHRAHRKRAEETANNGTEEKTNSNCKWEIYNSIAFWVCTAFVACFRFGFGSMYQTKYYEIVSSQLMHSNVKSRFGVCYLRICGILYCILCDIDSIVSSIYSLVVAICYPECSQTAFSIDWILFCVRSSYCLAIE